MERGARLLTGSELESLSRQGGGYRLHSTTGQTYDAGNVVVSAGGWLPALLGGLSLPAGFVAGLPEITVRQEQAFHFRYRDHTFSTHDGGAASGAGGWPTFIHKAAGIQAYGLPGGREHRVDVGGRHTRGESFSVLPFGGDVTPYSGPIVCFERIAHLQRNFADPAKTRADLGITVDVALGHLPVVDAGQARLTRVADRDATL